jgi:adenylosuccinate synthase
MKKIFFFYLLSFICFSVSAQDSGEKIMERRAREMMRVISLSDKEQWKKFVKENCTQAFIDKTMKAKVATSDNNNETTSTTTESADKLEAKAAMFARLHQDFGTGKITSLKAEGENVVMVVNDAELRGTFKLKFEKAKPYLIDGLGIEVEN